MQEEKNNSAGRGRNLLSQASTLTNSSKMWHKNTSIDNTDDEKQNNNPAFKLIIIKKNLPKVKSNTQICFVH